EIAERQITRSDLIRFRADPVTVIVWSPRLPFTKNQPPITVAITRPTASTTAAIKDPERSKYIGEETPFQNRQIATAQYTFPASKATKKHKTACFLHFLCFLVALL